MPQLKVSVFKQLVFTTASVFFGGQQTKGDIGKSYYYAKDYISAKRYMNEFIDENPNHANFESALRLVAEATEKFLPICARNEF